MRALYSAATGMISQQLNIDVISNNLANVNTVGFKKSRPDFQDLLYQTVREAGSSETTSTMVPTGIQIGYGSKLVATQKLFQQGAFKQTGAALDIAIDGKGFFQITLPDGTNAYTRAGSFKRDGNGNLVTSDGDPLSPAISFPSDVQDIQIGSDGSISIRQAGASSFTQLSQLQTALFPNPEGLKAMGGNLFLETESSGTATTGTPGQTGLGTIKQGFLESSNVNVVEELVAMIVGQRAYEINAKAIQTADDMLQLASQVKR